jgi:GNAT superfamily N-acetyltransferase
MSVHVTDAVADDADDIAALHAASWRATYRGILPDDFLDRQALDNRLRTWRQRMGTPPPTQIVLKAVDASGLCGFACLFLDADQQWGTLLDNLHVAPGRTGTGIGWFLLDASFARLRQERPEAPWLHLWVFEANAGARRFYECHGADAVERETVEVLPGISVPAVRYVWRALPPPCLALSGSGT